MTIAPDPPRPVSITQGAAVVVATRWIDRLIGIVSTLILARLLTPDDFGIVAMASLVVALIDALLDLGVNAALVQNRNTTPDDFNAAWTLRLIQSVLAGTIIGVAGGPFAADYFADPRVESVLWLMALSVAIGGIENIGIVAFQKNMEFGREFRFIFIRRMAGFLATLILALLLRSYWAMVFGTLVARLVGVGLSYAMHDFRPRLSVVSFGAIWSFSQWLLLRNLGTYGAQQIDKILVGRRAGASVLGAYNLADDISAMPVSELLAPIGRVLLPAFVQLADKPDALRRTFVLALGIQAMFALPAGIGLALVAESAVPVLLGAQWTAAIPLLQILALISAATALTHASGYLLLALGKVRQQAAVTWGQFLLLATLLMAAFPNSGAEGIASARLGVTLGAMVAFLILVIWVVQTVSLHDILGAIWRPLLATGVMAAVLSWPLATTLPAAFRLAAEIVLGGVTYGATLLLLWRLSGRQDGAERYVLDKLRRPRSTDIHISSSADIDSLPAAAIALMTAHRLSNVELTPGWFDNLQRTVFAGDNGVRYYVATRPDECIAVLPLRLGERGIVRTVEPIANFYTSLYQPALADTTTAGDIAAVLRQACRDHGNADEIRLAPMDPDSGAYRLLLDALSANGWVAFPYFCVGNWHLQVEGDWPTYMRNRPGEVQNTIKRLSRRFAAAGGTIEIVSGINDVEAATAAYVDVYAASWKKAEPYPDFMPGLIRHLAESGRLRLGIARLGGRPIAAQVWAVDTQRAAILKLAHRQDSTDYSPGTLLTALLMEHVISVDAVSEVDYLIGDDPYKQNWMNRRRERWGIVAFNPMRPIGLVLLMRELAARAIKSLIAGVKPRPSRHNRQVNLPPSS